MRFPGCEKSRYISTLRHTYTIKYIKCSFIDSSLENACTAYSASSTCACAAPVTFSMHLLFHIHHVRNFEFAPPPNLKIVPGSLERVLRTFLCHCRMAHDDGGFWILMSCFLEVSLLQESGKDGDRTMNVSIEPFTRLIWFMTLIVEFKTLPTFLHHRIWAWSVSSCHGRNL